MTERFACAQRLTQHLQGSKKQTTSRQGFLEILRRHTSYLKQQLLFSFRQHMATISTQWKTHGFVVFGVDGSDVSTPRTRSNQRAFTTNGKSKHQKRKRIKNQNAHQKKQKSCPRVLMTTLYHIALGLPWNWQLGSKSDNERDHLLAMLKELPTNALIVGDAGFTGFEFLSKVLASGSEIVIRVGSNVKLLKQLGKYRVGDNIVHIWPDWAMKKNRRPLVFRLVVVNNGKHPVYLITSILDSKRLSENQIVDIYRMRWEIELYHRNLKQTMGHRKLLSRSPRNALVELDWIILGYTAMMLYSVDEWIADRKNISQVSPAAIIRAFRQTARDYLHPIGQQPSLDQLIIQATKDNYQRTSSKQSRNYPQKRKFKQPKPPKIKNATKQQIKKIQSLPA
ncbi:MAG: IS4 family transposase [Planctomycetota bacterium]